MWDWIRGALGMRSPTPESEAPPSKSDRDATQPEGASSASSERKAEKGPPKQAGKRPQSKAAKKKRRRSRDAPKKPNRPKRKQPPGWAKEDRADGPSPRVPPRRPVEPAAPPSLLPPEGAVEPESPPPALEPPPPEVASAPSPNDEVHSAEAGPLPGPEVTEPAPDAAAAPAEPSVPASGGDDEASAPRASRRQREQATLAWIVVPKFEGLITEMQEVLKDAEADRDTLVNARARFVREWRALQPVPSSDAERLDAAYSEALAEVTRRIDATIDPRIEEEAKHVAMRETMIQAAMGLVELGDLKTAIRHAKDLQKEWRDAPRVDRDVAKDQNTRFRAAMDAVFARREQEEAERLVKLEAFVDAAEALTRSDDAERAAEAMKRLQAQWKETGGVRGEKGDAVWTRFRTAADRVFERRQEEREKMHARNLEVRQALIDEANGLADEGVEDADAVIRDLQRRWRQTGHVPREASDALWTAFRGALERIRNPPAMDPTALGDGQEGLSFNPFAGIDRDSS